MTNTASNLTASARSASGSSPVQVRFAILRVLIAGLTIVLAHPPHSVWPLILLSYPLFGPTVEGHSLRSVLFRSLLFGLVIEVGGTFWILPTIARFMGVAAEPTVATTAVGSVLFVAWAVAAALQWLIWGLLLAVPRSPNRWRWIWPALSLVAVDAFFPRVFPWDFGAAAIGWLPIAQASVWVGTLGLSFGFVAISALLYDGIRLWRSPNGGRSQGGLALGIAVAMALIWWGAGQNRLSEPSSGRVVRVGYVQPNIPLAEKASGLYANSVLERLVAGTQKALSQGAELVVWPEAMLFLRDEDLAGLTDALRSSPVPILIGAAYSDFNRAFLFRPGDAPVESYDKRRLLVFGERYPGAASFNALLSFLGVEQRVPTGTLSAGESVLVSEIDGVMFGVSICYEGILAPTAFELLDGHASVHLNLTEDLWYGDSAGPFQHLKLAHLRCIEAGLPLVRVTNGGYSAAYDACGRVLSETDLHVAASGVFEVPIQTRTSTAREFRAIFAHGSWIVVLCVVVLSRVWPRISRTRRTRTSSVALDDPS